MVKTEDHSSGAKLRLRRCEADGRFWTRTSEKVDRWLPATATDVAHNGDLTAIAVAQQLGGKGGSALGLIPLPDSDQKASSKPQTRARRGRPGEDYPADFEAIWTGCKPRKGNKSPAFKAWVKFKPDPIFTVERYQLRMRTDSWQRGFMQNLSTWLNDKGWETEPDPSEFATRKAEVRPATSFAVRAEQEREDRHLDRMASLAFGDDE